MSSIAKPVTVIFLDETFKVALQAHEAFALQAAVLEHSFAAIVSVGRFVIQALDELLK